MDLSTGNTLTDEADFIVNARGGLNTYVWPQVEGLWDFQGTVMHSAAWNEKYVLFFRYCPLMSQC
jgi:cation diffusion facilitator CzcD-associated flavoprotein CzcO